MSSDGSPPPSLASTFALHACTVFVQTKTHTHQHHQNAYLNIVLYSGMYLPVMSLRIRFVLGVMFGGVCFYCMLWTGCLIDWLSCGTDCVGCGAFFSTTIVQAHFSNSTFCSFILLLCRDDFMFPMTSYNSGYGYGGKTLSWACVGPLLYADFQNLTSLSSCLSTLSQWQRHGISSL